MNNNQTQVNAQSNELQYDESHVSQILSNQIAQLSLSNAKLNALLVKQDEKIAELQSQVDAQVRAQVDEMNGGKK